MRATRAILPLFTLLALAASPATAETYRCDDGQGGVVYTDDPAAAAGDCTPLGGGAGSLNIVPYREPVPSATGQAEQLIENRQARRQRQARLTERWTEEARSIAEDYRAAQRQRYHSPRRTQANITEALRKMELASRRKELLLRDMRQEGASAEQHGAIVEILKDVPEPPGEGEAGG